MILPLLPFLPLDFSNDPNGTLFWIWHDWQYEIEALIFGLIIAGYYFVRLRPSMSNNNGNDPVSTCDEFDKSGLIHIHEIAPEQEGASFLTFERKNGDLEDRQIGQPFTFFMENESIERHHLNPRGSYRCVDPKQLFKKYKIDIKELNRLAQRTEQLITRLRTGGYQNDKVRSHIRMFVILFFLAGMIGLGLAAVSHH